MAWLRLDPATAARERDGSGPRDGVVSHRSACLVHGLGEFPSPRTELTVRQRLSTREPSVLLHIRTAALDRGDVVTVDGLPVTTAERTIIDLLHAGVDAGQVGAVLVPADRRGMVDLDALAARATPFAARYAMRGASGTDLLAALAEEAGQRLGTGAER
ncbi:MAG TPA: hypothetical protein VGX23_15810 [Actinocrinis sp.]|nr:hypothetical protein [Actinocrinis sp.]